MPEKKTKKSERYPIVTKFNKTKTTTTTATTTNTRLKNQKRTDKKIMMKSLYLSTSNSQIMNTSQKTVSNTTTSSLSLRSLRLLCIFVASTTMSVKSFTIDTSSSTPAVNVPKIVTDATIRSMTKQNNVLPFSEPNNNRVQYSVGFGIRQPNTIVSTTSDDNNKEGLQSKNILPEDPYAFLVEHDAVNTIEPESIWKKRYTIDTVASPLSSSSTIIQNDKKKQTLPTVQLNRFTNDNEIQFNYNKNDIDLVQASAKTSIRNFYDLNTPWIDILIQTEQQKHQLMIAKNKQYQLTV